MQAGTMGTPKTSGPSPSYQLPSQAPSAQAAEHYEIARYGTLKTWAQELGLDKAVRLLDATLAEEKKTDATLTELAETAANQHAEAA